MDVNGGLAFLAGLASFLSPCVFSLIPGFIGYMGGRSIKKSNFSQTAGLTYRGLIGHSLLFFVGFGVIFIFPRVLVAELGGTLYILRDWLSKVGGILIIVFGLQIAGILKLSLLNKDINPASGSDRWRGYTTSGFIGAFFSAGWSPCVGPTLGSILTSGMAGSATSQTVGLLSFYLAGLALPFLLLASGTGWLAGSIISRFKHLSRITELVLGGLLIVSGGLLSLGIFEQTARFGFFINFGL
jgi:cytochrome c-type biogenesis protein